MCSCGFNGFSHWWIELSVAPYLRLAAASPEEATFYLRSWAAKIVRNGHMYLDTRGLAAKILATKHIVMTAECKKDSLKFDVLETYVVL